MTGPKPIHIIGGGMAGSEAAWQAGGLIMAMGDKHSLPAGGVKVFNTSGNEKVVSVARIADQGDDEE